MKYRITTMTELVEAASEENVDDLARDLGEWLRWHLTIRNLSLPGVTMKAAEFDWTDDGKPGPGAITVQIDREPEPPTRSEEL